MSCNPQPAGGGPPGSAADAVADVGGLRRVDHPGDLQLDPRRQGIEQPEALAEQHRDLVDLQLVQHTGLERPLRRVRAYLSWPHGSGGDAILADQRRPVA